MTRADLIWQLYSYVNELVVKRTLSNSRKSKHQLFYAKASRWSTFTYEQTLIKYIIYVVNVTRNAAQPKLGVG